LSQPVKIIFRFILFVLVQIFILNQMPPLHRFITPYLYFLFIIWLPFNTGKSWLLIISFLLGLSVDFFLKTPGLHAACCVLVAFVRPFIINLLIPKETKELKLGAPSVYTMNLAPYALYVALLTFIHHAYLVMLEWLQFGSFWYFIGKVFFTSLISFLLIAVTELLFRSSGKRLKR
jgi:hypothetical protein